MGNIGAAELMLIFLAVLLVFGAKRIPEIARGLGKGIREFKDATREIQRELRLEETDHRVREPRPYRTAAEPAPADRPAESAKVPSPVQNGPSVASVD